MTKTANVRFNGALLKLRRANVRDRIEASVIAQRLEMILPQTQAIEVALRSSFGKFMSQVEAVDGSIGFEIINANSAEDDLVASYRAFLDCDEVLYEQIEMALTALSIPENMKKYLPPGFLSDDEKKDTPTTEPSTAST